jgi:hypothetical protein
VTGFATGDGVMGSRVPPGAAADNLGISINDNAGRWAIVFDIEAVERFKLDYGADTFVEMGCRYVEEQCESLGLLDDLWLWQAAVRAMDE